MSVLASLRLALTGIKPYIRWRSVLYRCKQRWQKALTVLRMMVQFVKPDATHCNAVLSACAANMKWQQGATVFEGMGHRSLEPDVFSFTTLAGRCTVGQWTLALGALSLLPSKLLRADIILCREVMKSYKRDSLWTLSLLSLGLMSEVNLQIDAPSCAHFMNTCSSWRLALHTTNGLAKYLYEADLPLFNILQSSYGKTEWQMAATGLERACHMRLHPDPVSLCVSFKRQHWQQSANALSLMDQMQSREVQPNVNCYNCIAHVCGNRWSIVLSILCSMQQLVILPDAVTVNTCLRAMDSWALPLGLITRVAKMSAQPDALSWLCLTEALEFSKSSWLQAVQVLSHVRISHLQPSLQFHSAIKKCCKSIGLWSLALDLISSASDEGDYSASTATCAVASCWQLALYLTGIERWGLQQDVVSLNSCSSVLEKSREWSAARALLQNVRQRQVEVSEESLRTCMSASGTSKRWVEALACWPRLRAAFRPEIASSASCNAALSAVEQGGWQQTLKLWKAMCKSNFLPDDLSYNAAVSCLASFQDPILRDIS